MSHSNILPIERDVQILVEDASDDEGGATELTGVISGILVNSTVLYSACRICKKKVKGDNTCPNGHESGGDPAAVAKLELEFQENDNLKELVVQAFSTELALLQGQPLHTFETVEQFERDFSKRCPISLKFQITTDHDNRTKLTSVANILPFH